MNRKKVMASVVEPLIALNNEIKEASSEDNFSRILYLDTQRRELLKSLATNPLFKSDNYSLKVLEQTAYQNQSMVIDLTNRMTTLTRVTNDKIKMIRSYRKAG